MKSAIKLVGAFIIVAAVALQLNAEVDAAGYVMRVVTYGMRNVVTP